jgi:hypothetical protein
MPALAGLEWAIRHKPNRTPTLENAEFLLSLVRAKSVGLKSSFASSSSPAPAGDPVNPTVRDDARFRGGYGAIALKDGRLGGQIAGTSVWLVTDLLVLSGGRSALR